MDELRARFRLGRIEMRDAFVDLALLAARAGVDEDTISAMHGRFFDGHVVTKGAFAATLLLAEMRRTP